MKTKRRKVQGEFYPCTCDDYNGGQCYNCLNGAHRICEGEKPCNLHKKKRGRKKSNASQTN